MTSAVFLDTIAGCLRYLALACVIAAFLHLATLAVRSTRDTFPNRA